MPDLLAYIREGRTMTRSEKLRLIVQLSVPSILAQISATVMFFIDAAMVGHLGEKATASIGLVETTTWLMGGLGTAANMGFSVQVAHFIGANDFESARRVLRQALVCCALWSLTLSLSGIIIHHRLPFWLGGSADIAADASTYFLIVGIAGIAFQMSGLAGSMLKCSGNMKVPSMLNILMCVMDVGFNYIFIYMMDMGVKGAAMGTATSAPPHPRTHEKQFQADCRRGAHGHKDWGADGSAALADGRRTDCEHHHRGTVGNSSHRCQLAGHHRRESLLYARLRHS